MKLNAIFEYDDFCEKLAEFYGFSNFDDEYEAILEKIRETIFEPELYKEVGIYKVPVDFEVFSDEAEEREVVAQKMTEFAIANNIEKILITSDMDQLKEI